MSKNNSLQDRIPSDLSDSISKIFTDKLTQDDFRNKVKEIFAEYTDSVSFMDKVKGYAGREIDEKIFKSGTTIVIWLASLVIAGIIGSITTKLIK